MLLGKLGLLVVSKACSEARLLEAGLLEFGLSKTNVLELVVGANVEASGATATVARTADALGTVRGRFDSSRTGRTGRAVRL